VRVDEPVVGTGVHECTPHDAPIKRVCHATDVKKPLRAAVRLHIPSRQTRLLFCSIGANVTPVICAVKRVVKRGLTRHSSGRCAIKPRIAPEFRR
jgi:hypothetical protein